jgi:transposase
MDTNEWEALVGGWEGFEVERAERRLEGTPPRPTMRFYLRARSGQVRRCSRCGEPVSEVHEYTEREVRDLPVFDAETVIVFTHARLACPRCGSTTALVPWLDKHQRITTRLAEKIARLAGVLPLKHVAAECGVSWDVVKRVHQRALTQQLGPITAERLAGLRVLAIDEFAIQKGHRYATVIVEPTTKRVVWLARGRERASIRPFFELLGAAGCARIEAVAMDMWGPYHDEVRAHCPQAAIVYDLFHVVAKYGREVIDRVRVDETNRIARANGPNDLATRTARRVIKGTRWLLLKNRANLTRRADRVRLKELLTANRPLFIAYVLKDDLKQLWRFRYPGAALRWWRAWYRRALASRLPALIKFATLLARNLHGLLAHCRYPLHTGLVEGINNKIKVLKRMAYGFRDDTYFFLRIRAAFPGNS